MTSLPMLPTVVTDMVGSAIIIVLSVLSLRYAFFLTRRRPENFLWGYFFYFCVVLTVFSISRAMGHIVKQMLLMSGYPEAWRKIAPFSGGFNTLLIIAVSSVTIFYHKGVEAFHIIQRETKKLKLANRDLETAATEMTRMNFYLEEMVEERTRELSKSEKKFRHLFTNSKDMVYICDMDQNLLDINASGLEMLGYDTDSPKRYNLRDFFQNEEEIDSYMETIKAQGFIKDLEIEFRRADDSILYVLLTVTAIHDEQGNVIGCEGIAKDLTNLKAMMMQLVNSEKMASVGQMAAGIAHEINTPLGIILGYSQLMMDDFAKDDESHQNLEVIERQTKACRKIVADLLKFSRMSEGTKERIHINEALTDILAVVEHNLNLNHIDVKRDFVENMPLVIGDVEKIRQVFVNLINNASQAMEQRKGGTLIVKTRYDRRNKEVIATIRDTGSGISEDVKKRIFEPFFTTKSVGQGTGLGLSVSYGIIEDHGGRITVESPVYDTKAGALVEGTAMHVHLPEARELAIVTDKKDFIN